MSPRLSYPEIVKELVEGKLSEGHKLSLTIHSGSMWPVLQIGDLISVHPVLNRKIKPGNIAVYFSNGKFIVHRVRAVESDSGNVTLRGDSTLWNDPVQQLHSLIGVVTKVTRNNKEIILESVPGRILDFFSPVTAKIFLYGRLLRPKLVDLMVRASPRSFRQQIGRFLYRGIIGGLRLGAKMTGLNGYLTRSAATQDIVAGRTDLDLILIAKDVTDCCRIAASLQKTSLIVPIISDPAVVPWSWFSYWIRYGGNQRLEAIAWQSIGTPGQIVPLANDQHLRLSLLQGGYDLYKKLWDALIALSLPSGIYHAKNISNFQKYCIDAIRWSKLLKGEVTIDILKLPRMRFLESVQEEIRRQENGSQIYAYLAGPAVMDSATRAQTTIGYFLWIASRLESSTLQYVHTHAISEEIIKNFDAYYENDAAIFTSFDSLDADILYAHVIGEHPRRYPVTPQLLPVLFFIRPYTQTYLKQGQPTDMQQALLRRDLAEIAMFLGYYPAHVDAKGLRAFAQRLLPLHTFCTTGEVISDRYELITRYHTAHPYVSKLVLTSALESLTHAERKKAFEEMYGIIEELIELTSICQHAD